MATAALAPVDQASAIAALPRDLAIMKLENETIQSMVAARPRDYSLIKEELAEQLAEFPVLATEAIYTKPVGREPDVCEACGKEAFRDKRTGAVATQCFSCKSPKIKEGQMKYAQGLSVRAAETLAEAVGFNRVRADVTPIDEFTVKVEATYTDYQRGRIWQDGGIVSKQYKSRKGDVFTHSDDRFYNVVLKAEKSKFVREVIVRSLPAGLKAWFWEECERISSEVLDDATVQKILAQFANKGVNQEMIEKVLGVPLANGWTKTHRQMLAGIWTAIKDGETTVAEAFDLEPVEPVKKTATVKPEDITGEKKPEESKQETKTEPHGESAGMSDDDKVLAGFEQLLEVTDGKLKCDSMRDRAKKEHPHLAAQIDEMTERRIAAIGGGRGANSNK